MTLPRRETPPMRWSIILLAVVVLAGACRGNPAAPPEVRVQLRAWGDTIVYTTPGAARSSDFLVAATNAATGRPVSGVEVSWEVTSGNASMGAAQSTTDDYGIAASWITQPGAGTYVVRATTPSLSGPPLPCRSGSWSRRSSAALNPS
jgi:hypothetical protein